MNLQTVNVLIIILVVLLTAIPSSILGAVIVFKLNQGNRWGDELQEGDSEN